jgi:NADH-quinone oxidoreductase subunit J
MKLETVLFFLFASVSIASATMVVSSKNPVHSILYLVLVFFNASGLLLLIKVEFLAMIFLVVYVGAIAVLFLFVVMMLNIRIAELSENTLRYMPIGGLIGVIFVLEFFLIIEPNFLPLNLGNLPVLEDINL